LRRVIIREREGKRKKKEGRKREKRERERERKKREREKERDAHNLTKNNIIIKTCLFVLKKNTIIYEHYTCHFDH